MNNLGRSILQTFIIKDWERLTDRNGKPYLRIDLNDLIRTRRGLVFDHVDAIRGFRRGERVWVTARDEGDVLIITQMESV